MATTLEIIEVEKSFGSVIANSGINVKVDSSTVTCILGDNGAGKSTLIKILSGVHKPTKGQYMVEGVEVNFNSPRDALDAGIATVFQDLATIPLMSIWRNFFIGNEIEKGFGPFKWLDVKKMKELTKQELLAMGIDHRVELIFDDIAVYIEINTALGQDAGWVIERIVGIGIGVGICVSVGF